MKKLVQAHPTINTSAPPKNDGILRAEKKRQEIRDLRSHLDTDKLNFVKELNRINNDKATTNSFFSNKSASKYSKNKLNTIQINKSTRSFSKTQKSKYVTGVLNMSDDEFDKMFTYQFNESDDEEYKRIEKEIEERPNKNSIVSKKPKLIAPDIRKSNRRNRSVMGTQTIEQNQPSKTQEPMDSASEENPKRAPRKKVASHNFGEQNETFAEISYPEPQSNASKQSSSVQTSQKSISPYEQPPFHFKRNKARPIQKYQPQPTSKSNQNITKPNNQTQSKQNKRPRKLNPVPKANQGKASNEINPNQQRENSESIEYSPNEYHNYTNSDANEQYDTEQNGQIEGNDEDMDNMSYHGTETYESQIKTNQNNIQNTEQSENRIEYSDTQSDKPSEETETHKIENQNNTQNIQSNINSQQSINETQKSNVSQVNNLLISTNPNYSLNHQIIGEDHKIIYSQTLPIKTEISLQDGQNHKEFSQQQNELITKINPNESINPSDKLQNVYHQNIQNELIDKQNSPQNQSIENPQNNISQFQNIIHGSQNILNLNQNANQQIYNNQQQPMIINNQNQFPISMNNNQQQLLINNQNQVPISINNQQQQQVFINNQNQVPISMNNQQQQVFMNNQNQVPISINNNQQQQVFINNQNQVPTSLGTNQIPIHVSSSNDQTQPLIMSGSQLPNTGNSNSQQNANIPYIQNNEQIQQENAVSRVNDQQSMTQQLNSRNEINLPEPLIESNETNKLETQPMNQIQNIIQEPSVELQQSRQAIDNGVVDNTINEINHQLNRTQQANPTTEEISQQSVEAIQENQNNNQNQLTVQNEIKIVQPSEVKDSIQSNPNFQGMQNNELFMQTQLIDLNEIRNSQHLNEQLENYQSIENNPESPNGQAQVVSNNKIAQQMNDINHQPIVDSNEIQNNVTQRSNEQFEHQTNENPEIANNENQINNKSNEIEITNTPLQQNEQNTINNENQNEMNQAINNNPNTSPIQQNIDSLIQKTNVLLPDNRNEIEVNKEDSKMSEYQIRKLNAIKNLDPNNLLPNDDDDEYTWRTKLHAREAQLSEREARESAREAKHRLQEASVREREAELKLRVARLEKLAAQQETQSAKNELDQANEIMNSLKEQTEIGNNSQEEKQQTKEINQVESNNNENKFHEKKQQTTEVNQAESNVNENINQNENELVNSEQEPEIVYLPAYLGKTQSGRLEIGNDAFVQEFPAFTGREPESEIVYLPAYSGKIEFGQLEIGADRLVQDIPAKKSDENETKPSVVPKSTNPFAINSEEKNNDDFTQISSNTKETNQNPSNQINDEDDEFDPFTTANDNSNAINQEETNNEDAVDIFTATNENEDNKDDDEVDVFTAQNDQKDDKEEETNNETYISKETKTKEENAFTMDSEPDQISDVGSSDVQEEGKNANPKVNENEQEDQITKSEENKNQTDTEVFEEMVSNEEKDLSKAISEEMKDTDNDQLNGTIQSTENIDQTDTEEIEEKVTHEKEKLLNAISEEKDQAIDQETENLENEKENEEKELKAAIESEDDDQTDTEAFEELVFNEEDHLLHAISEELHQVDHDSLSEAIDDIENRKNEEERSLNKGITSDQPNLAQEQAPEDINEYKEREETNENKSHEETKEEIENQNKSLLDNENEDADNNSNLLINNAASFITEDSSPPNNPKEEDENRESISHLDFDEGEQGDDEDEDDLNKSIKGNIHLEKILKETEERQQELTEREEIIKQKEDILNEKARELQEKEERLHRIEDEMKKRLLQIEEKQKDNQDDEIVNNANQDENDEQVQVSDKLAMSEHNERDDSIQIPNHPTDENTTKSINDDLITSPPVLSITEPTTEPPSVRCRKLPERVPMKNEKCQVCRLPKKLRKQLFGNSPLGSVGPK